MDNNDWSNYFKKSNCAICNGPLTGETVKDHNYLTGEFRGAAHNQCNLQYQLPKFVPVIFHNLSGYDSHLFIKQLGKSHGSINCIPNNEEKYISFSKSLAIDENNLRLDSLTALNLWRHQLITLAKIFRGNNLGK